MGDVNSNCSLTEGAYEQHMNSNKTSKCQFVAFHYCAFQWHANSQVKNLMNDYILCCHQLSLPTSHPICHYNSLTRFLILCRVPEEKTYLVRVIGEGSVGEIVVSILVSDCLLMSIFDLVLNKLYRFLVFYFSYSLASLVHRGGR